MVLSMTNVASSQNEPVIVNLMIVTDIPRSPTAEQVDRFDSSLVNMFNVINGRYLNATMYLTQDVASSDSRLMVTQLAIKSNFELAVAGNHTNEKLSIMHLAEQEAILTRSKKIAEACHICGPNGVMLNVTGFLPQSFDQNEGTYIVLDQLGFLYDSGFQAGILYAPGHEKDIWPYKYPNHNFYAVPISTYDVSGEKVYLEDSYLKSKGLSGSQWYDLLTGKFEDAASKGEPMVILLNTSTSGSGDFLDALAKFLDYAISKDARFVTSMELVNMSIIGVYEAPVSEGKAQTQDVNLTQIGNGSSTCKACSEYSKAAISFGPTENVSANMTITAPKLVL
jgi:hypothetical protein